MIFFNFYLFIQCHSYVYITFFLVSKMKIVDIVSRWPGSVHDSTMFTHSSLFQQLRNAQFGADSTILADSGYGSEQFICKPLNGLNTQSERSYQFAQIQTRNIVERTIGVWKNTFGCLSKGFVLKTPERVQDIIVACAVLHNMLIEENMDVTNDELENQDRISRMYIQTQMTDPGFRIQDFLINNYFNQ